MSNVTTVSLKLAPEHYAVVKAMAQGQGVSVSEFLRETLQDALDLERQLERLADFFGDKCLLREGVQASRVEL